VETANKYVKKGNAALRGAIEMQRKTRKCYCCIMITVIIVILILVAGMGSFFSGAIKTG
jgi:t-SNARE complex subunit (syntaxin)